MVKGRLRTLSLVVLERQDKREVVTPTSFILNLKQLAETWEFNRLILVWQSILK